MTVFKVLTVSTTTGTKATPTTMAIAIPINEPMIGISSHPPSALKIELRNAQTICLSDDPDEADLSLLPLPVVTLPLGL